MRIWRKMRVGLKGSSGLGANTSTSSSSPSPSPSPSPSSPSGNDAGDFECNICFELAQDPIVTRCGHLYCWPCLYEWLCGYSHSNDCPVCKAVIQVENLVPLYARGTSQTDPRSKTFPGLNIPNRPSARRPPPNDDGFSLPRFEFTASFAPLATMRFGNFTLFTDFGVLSGLLASLFGISLHMFSSPGSHTEPENQVENQPEEYLKKVFFMIGLFVLFYLVLL